MKPHFPPIRKHKPPSHNRKNFSHQSEQRTAAHSQEAKKSDMPLNKFLAHAGICARRAAVALIQQGKVRVNELVIKRPEYRVKIGKDQVYYLGKKLHLQVPLHYLLLNKPKDCLSTTADPKGRRTVMDMVQSHVSEKIYPVGRLDRNTTGLILLTNDGALAEKLTHPKYKVKKIYQVSLNKPLSENHLNAYLQGIYLEDGLAQADDIAYLDASKRRIGIALHSGKNRIIRRMLAHFSYEVESLDRVVYGPLTKKNLPRGKFRPLTPKEIIYLKHFK